MSTLTRHIRNVAFAAGVLGTLGFGASAARAEVSRSIILDSAEECQAYCTNRGNSRWSWDPNTGACRCWL